MNVKLKVKRPPTETGVTTVEGTVEFTPAELEGFVAALTVSRLANTSRFTPREAVAQSNEVARQFAEAHNA